MPEIVKDDMAIYYESHGQGDPLILIRGLGSNADHWYAQVPDLSRHWRIIVFDNRGIARSSDPGGAFTVGDMVEDTMALMDGLDISRAHVLGLSMGGMIAQELALNYPQRLRGLILVVTHCGGQYAVGATKDVTDAIQRVTAENSDEARLAAMPFFFAPRTMKEQPQVIQEYATVSMKYPASPEILTRQMQAISQHDTYDRLRQITSPTLVMTGTEDVLIPPENSRILADSIPGAKLEVIPDGGHQVLIEAPQACNRAIIEFLQQVEADGK